MIDKNLKNYAVYDSGHIWWKIGMKQGQSLQTCPKQGYNNVKFEKSHLNSVREKASEKVFVKSGNMPVISLE